jgi:dihydropteroate synthase
MSKAYHRPIHIVEGAEAARALDEGRGLPLAGGRLVFLSVEVITRSAPSEIIPVSELGKEARFLVTPREPVAGLSFDKPRIMGILNVTPDSFSDGGDLEGPERVVVQAKAMAEAGADILDVGGESTRPGSVEVSIENELARVLPAVEALVAAKAFAVDGSLVISIDTRKPDVFEAALLAGASVINDVSALTFSEDASRRAAKSKAPVILMHAQGDPKSMQNGPYYDNVLLDVYDWLEGRIGACEEAGIPRDKIIIDPGIGFGKTLEHNLRLLGGLSLFHGLGCPLLLGASRKSFIHSLSHAPNAKARLGGSLAAVLSGYSQGVQIFRVHDVQETVQALSISNAIGRFL